MEPERCTTVSLPNRCPVMSLNGLPIYIFYNRNNLRSDGDDVAAAFPPPDQDWWTLSKSQQPRLCKNCGEERQVEEISDFRGTQGFCAVCSHSWWLIGGPKNYRD